MKHKRVQGDTQTVCDGHRIIYFIKWIVDWDFKAEQFDMRTGENRTLVKGHNKKEG